MRVRHELKKALVRCGYYSVPGFLIIGAQKAGTTLLYSYLSQHPDIFRPAFKEPHFFDREENYKKGKAQYFKNFELPFRYGKGQVTFEATADTIYFPWCAGRVKELSPDVKLIAILRDPVHRAFSQWNMGHYHRKEGDDYFEPRSFEEAIDDELSNGVQEEDPLGYLSRGVYARQLKRFFRIFPEKRILILDHGSMKADLDGTLRRTTDHLGLSPFGLGELDEGDRFYTGKASYKEGIPPEKEEQLREWFKPNDEELEKFLGRRFSWME